jgi:hypothetical protein
VTEVRIVRRPMICVTLAMVVACTGEPGPAPDSTEQPTTSSIVTVEATTTSTQPTTTTTATPLTTSTTTTTQPPATTPTTTADGAMIVLRHDGLGVVSFGEPVDTVMEVLTGLLGPPSWDEIQQSPDIDRSVAWGDDGEEILYIQFTTWDHFDGVREPPGPMPDGPVFHYYLTKSGLFATEAGITIDSPVSDLVAAYPGLRAGEGCAHGAGNVEFSVDPPDPEVWLALPIFGLLDGELDDQTTRIVYIGAGWDRTPC